MKSNAKFALCIALIAVLAAPGCATVLIGVAAVTAINIAHDRRTVGSFIDDGAVEVKVKTNIYTDDQLKGKAHVNVTSVNGVVLLTGELPSETLRERATQVAKKAPEARQVVNEIKVAGASTLMSRSNDSYLTSKVKTNLFSAPNVDATRIKIVTEDAVVYLMGLVTKIEAEAATNTARKTGGVARVVKVFEYID